MFHYIMEKIRFYSTLNNCDNRESEQKINVESDFSDSLEENLKTISSIILDSSDLVIRRFTFGNQGQTEAAIIYIDGLVDKTLVNENILKPLMLINNPDCEEAPHIINADYVKSELLFVGGIEMKTKVQEIVGEILSGDTVLFLDGSKEALDISLRGWQTRGISEPQTESTVRGSREGFTETLRINTSMLRRKIKNPSLKLETLTLGERTRTDVCIAYINDLANPKLIKEVRRRLTSIKTDAILESGYIEQYIEDAPFSIFSTVGNSEKPDKVAAKLLEGRAAIFVDGTPFVLTVPMVFFESFQSAEDYYSRPYFASLIRIVRVISFLISILAPALYVALSTFHQELIPTPLLITMAGAHDGVPFPAVIEAGIMMLCFDILREAGVRLPRPVGSAVSIVGALVIGEAAVSAGLIGAPMVIVVALTAVASFVVPPQTDSGVILRYTLLILASFLGGFGITIGLFAVFIYMCSLRSFGTPYMTPLTPFSRSGMTDYIIRAPIWTMIRRPKYIAWNDTIRQKPGQKPSLPNENESDPEGT